MGKKSTPTPPDLSSLSNAQLEISRQQLAQAQKQMDMSQSQFDKFVAQTNLEMQQSQKQYDQQLVLQNRSLDQADAAAAVSKSVADKQIEAMDQNMGFAQQDRERYQNTFIPLQDQAISEAMSYDSPARREQAAAQALADNQTQIEAQRSNVAAQMAAMGVDPSQVMSTSLANQMGVAGAATGAMNANNARQQVDATGRQLRASAIDMGNGLPAQSQAGYGVASAAGQGASNAANGAVNNYSAASGIGATATGIRQSSLNTASSITGSPMAWAQMGNQSYGGASNGIMNSSSIQNQQFQNQMSAQKMKNDQAAATMNAIGSVASIAGMAMMAEGGMVQYGQHVAPQVWDHGPAPRVALAFQANGMPPRPTQMPRQPAPGMPPPAMSGGVMPPRPPQMPHYPAMGTPPPVMGGSMGGVMPPRQIGTMQPRRLMAEGGSVFDGGDVTSWKQFDTQMDPSKAGMMLPAAAAKGKGMGWAAALQNASSMPGFGGPEQSDAPDANLQQQWLRPVMRAEGGAMDYYAEGNAPSQYRVMPNVQSRDQIPVMLSPGEIVIPADVSRIKGQEFFDKLIQKHHRPGA